MKNLEQKQWTNILTKQINESKTNKQTNEQTKNKQTSKQTNEKQTNKHLAN